MEESMKTGDLVKSIGTSKTADVALVIEITQHPGGTAVHILLNDGRKIWVGAGMLEIVNATG
jgi:hypothetical protein